MYGQDCLAIWETDSGQLRQQRFFFSVMIEKRVPGRQSVRLFSDT